MSEQVGLRPQGSPDLMGPTKGDASMISRFRSAALACFVALAAGAAFAQGASPQEALYIKSLAATCANCHGTAGQAVAGSANASLAGRTDIAAQMKAFKSGARPATVMHQLAKGYSDAQIEVIAAYFAAQKK
jgi:sulfide dehydrogenase cytochrome subunit